MLAYPSPVGQMTGRLLAAVGSGTFPGPRPDFFLLEMLLEVDPEPSEASMSPDSVASGSGVSKSSPTPPDSVASLGCGLMGGGRLGPTNRDSPVLTTSAPIRI